MEAENVMSVAELKKALECPICFETRKAGPLYQCKNGHILCSVCIETVQECPQCRVKFPVTRIRCLFAEQQREMLPKQCKYSDNGCDYEQMPSRMPSRKQVFIDHENDCRHRNIICFFNTACNAQVSLSKILHHMKDIHKSEPINVEKDIRNAHMLISSKHLKKDTDIYWVAAKFTLEGKQFYLNHFRLGRLGHFFLWVYLIGTKKEEEKFTYSITLFNVNKSESQSCKRKVISIDTPWKDICSMESAMAMAIPDAVMKSFMGSVGNANEGIEIPYTVKIESVQNNSTKRKRTED